MIPLKEFFFFFTYSFQKKNAMPCRTILEVSAWVRWGGNFLFDPLRFFSLVYQVDIRQIKRIKASLIRNIQVPPPSPQKKKKKERERETQGQVRQLRLTCYPELINGSGTWGFKGDKGNSKDNKSRCLVIRCLPYCIGASQVAQW